MCNIVMLTDFNLVVITPFESELVEFYSSYVLIISDYYDRDSEQFTYVSDALDHITCSYDVNSKILLNKILEK